MGAAAGVVAAEDAATELAVVSNEDPVAIDPSMEAEAMEGRDAMTLLEAVLGALLEVSSACME
jgi:hypothetical protein